MHDIVQLMSNGDRFFSAREYGSAEKIYLTIHNTLMVEDSNSPFMNTVLCRILVSKILGETFSLEDVSEFLKKKTNPNNRNTIKGFIQQYYHQAYLKVHFVLGKHLKRVSEKILEMIAFLQDESNSRQRIRRIEEL